MRSSASYFASFGSAGVAPISQTATAAMQTAPGACGKIVVVRVDIVGLLCLRASGQTGRPNPRPRCVTLEIFGTPMPVSLQLNDLRRCRGIDHDKALPVR